MMGFRCVWCEKNFEVDELVGSMKHPYCKDCFKKVWKSMREYQDFLENEHE